MSLNTFKAVAKPIATTVAAAAGMVIGTTLLLGATPETPREVILLACMLLGTGFTILTFRGKKR